MIKRRTLGEVIIVGIGTDSLGRFFWFEAPAGLPERASPPPGTTIHGPFATLAECEESQRLVLFGPQCEVSDGGPSEGGWPA
jgi:hypothetical protein